MEETTGRQRRLHNEELHNWYSSQGIITTALEKVRWEGKVAYMGEKISKFCLENLEERDH
jgi:hypothetical protein